MKLFKHVVRAMDQNVYFYYDENTREGVIIDPGDDAERIMSLVEENDIKVKAILLTHGHGDHIGAIPKIRQKYDWPIVAHDWEIEVLKDEGLNYSRAMNGGVSFEPEILLKDGDTIKVGEAELKVLHTPGHTVGGVSFYSAHDNIVFTGDTLFYASIGRTDFPNPPMKDGKGFPLKENFPRLIAGIKEKLYTLPDETVVYPGHGGESRIGFEKKYNPFVKG